MSYAFHAKPLEALEWADLQELVDHKAEESATLEFKGADIWDVCDAGRGGGAPTTERYGRPGGCF